MVRNQRYCLTFLLFVSLSTFFYSSAYAECPQVNDAVNHAYERYVEDASRILVNTISEPEPVHQSACLGEIQSLSNVLSILDPSRILTSLENRVCKAARDRIRETQYTLLDQIRKSVDLPYGLSGHSQNQTLPNTNRRSASEMLWHVLN